MSTSFIVRPLTAADAEQRRELRLESLRDFPTSFGSTYAQWASRPIESYAQVPAPEDGLFAGAFDDSRMVGMAGIVRFEASVSPHWAHLIGMYVRPSHWGSGAAEAIVGRLIDYAKGRFEYVELTVTDGNERARRFYERVGFREFGRRPAGLRHADRDYDEILMWRAL